MKISVFVKTNSKIESVSEREDGSYIVRVSSRPTEGKANQRICDLLALYFKTSKSKVLLISGFKSKNKRFEIVL